MTNKQNKKIMNKEKGLYIKPTELSGPAQMATDLFLLEKSFTENDLSVAIRFYTWDGNWISIGRNQKFIPEKWKELSKTQKIKIVRRPSGGQAVLHSGGLTYALIWKNPPKNKKQSYLITTKWLIKAFKRAGIDLFFGDQSPSIHNRNCFSTSTIADLVDKTGHKYIGSAQFWKKGHLLQHGEILIGPSQSLWKDIFNTIPPKIKTSNIKKDILVQFLKESITSSWDKLKWISYEFADKEIETIEEIAKSQFYEFSHF